MTRVNQTYGTHILVDRLRLNLFNLNATLSNIYIEDYKGDTLIYVNELNTSILAAKEVISGNLKFGKANLKGVQFNLITYPGERDSNLDVFVAQLDDGQPRPEGTPPFYLSIENVEMSDGRFVLIDHNKRPTSLVDFKEVVIEGETLEVIGPNVSVEVTHLSLLESNGLRVKNMQSQFSYTKEQMRFEGMELETEKSNIAGTLGFYYDRDDFSAFYDKVILSGTLTNGRVALEEVNLYYPEFGRGQSLEFETRVQGVLNNLQLNEFLAFSNDTGVRGDFTLLNLFNAEAPFKMEGKIRNLSTNYYSLRALMPKLLGDNLPETVRRLGDFTIRGETLITETSLDAKVNISTQLGNSYTDLQMTNIHRKDDISYRGVLSLVDFELGTFLEKKELGQVSLDAFVEGKGFLAEKLNTKAEAEISKLEFNDYDYSNIKLRGYLRNQLFDGNLLCNDPNFRFDFKGLVDFRNKINDVNFTAAVDYADLVQLNFLKDSIGIFRGLIKMDATGTNLDNVVGELIFQNTRYQNNTDEFFFEDFSVTSTFEENGERNLQFLSPDIITGYLKGNFKVAELDKLIQNAMGSIYTNYSPYTITEGQKVDFNFRIYNKIVEVFFPEVALGANTFIRGSMAEDGKDFKLTFKSPLIEVFKNKFTELELKIDNQNPLFNTFLSVGNMETVYYDVKDFNLINTTLKDTLFFRTEFKGGSQFNDSYNLNFYHTFTKNQKSVIGLKKSDLSFKGNKWIINAENDAKNKVILGQNLDSIHIEDLVINNNQDEQIRLRGALADSTYKDLELQFKIVSLDKITPEIDSLKLDGKVDGFLNILQKDNKYLPSSSMFISQFSINQMELGDLELVIFGNDDLTEFGVNSFISQNGKDIFDLGGKVYNQPDKVVLDLTASLKEFNLEPFAPLGEGVISGIRGMATGTVSIVDHIKSPKLNGELFLDNAGLGIVYTNTDYSMASKSRVKLYDQTFYFDNIALTDTKFETNAQLAGSISHTNFDNWVLGLNVEATQDRFLILDKEYDPDELYFGTGFVKGVGSIYGNTNALNIDFVGETARGSVLKIPLSDVTTVGDYSFITFANKKKSLENNQERLQQEFEGINMEFELDVTPDAEIEIVVDQKTGSTLKGTGEGLLFFEIDTNDKFNMYGDFAVVTGEFRFRRGGIIDKTFIVRPPGYITWSGDPYAAQLNMKAVYQLNANPAPLLDDGTRAVRRIPTEVAIIMDGALEDLQLKFDIQFPNANSVLKSELEYLLQDPTIEEQNAFFLLAQGTFVNPQSGFNQRAIAGNILGETASSLLNQMLGGNGDKFNLGLSYEQGFQDDTANLETEDRIGVTVSTQISDRILVNGRVGVPIGGGGVSETVVAGDVEVQIMLNDNGTFSAKIFNRQNEIQQFLTERQGYTQGVGLSYQVDFDDFADLMQLIFKKKSSIPVQTQPAEMPSATDDFVKFKTKNSSAKQQ